MRCDTAPQNRCRPLDRRIAPSLIRPTHPPLTAAAVSASGMSLGAVREAEQIDAVALAPDVDEELVGRQHIVVEPVAGEEPQHGIEILPTFVPGARPR